MYYGLAKLALRDESSVCEGTNLLRVKAVYLKLNSWESIVNFSGIGFGYYMIEERFSFCVESMDSFFFWKTILSI